MIDYIGETKINYNTKKRTIVKHSSDIYEELKELRCKKQEHFAVVYLDGANSIIETRVITIGTLNRSLVHPREVFAPAIENRSASIILTHNHPSGLIEPSEEDKKITKRLVEGSKILGIEILDHIIITSDGYYSFKDEILL